MAAGNRILVLQVLQEAIDQVASGNVLVLLDSPDGREKLLGWLTELRDLRIQNDARAKRDSMETLTGLYGLTEEEAVLVWQSLSAGRQLEYEEGRCRKCNGLGRVEVFERGGCFGSVFHTESCFTCNGKGVDPKRIKVPEAVVP